MGTNHVPILGFDAAVSEPILTPSEVVYLAGEQFDPTWCAIHGVSMGCREHNGEV